MGNFSIFLTLFVGIKFVAKPVMTTKEVMESISATKRAVQSLTCGSVIGFICGFVGAGGGMMMLIILVSMMGYELKTLNRATGLILVILALVIIVVRWL